MGCGSVDCTISAWNGQGITGNQGNGSKLYQSNVIDKIATSFIIPNNTLKDVEEDEYASKGCQRAG
jgi:hypothetical protein